MGVFVLGKLRITHLEYKFAGGFNDMTKQTDST